MASAELAVSLVALLLVLALVLGALRAGMDRSAAVSVAGGVAREAARGGDTAAAWARLRSGLPAGSTVTLDTGGGFVSVTVAVPLRGGLAGAALPDVLHVQATAVLERP